MVNLILTSENAAKKVRVGACVLCVRRWRAGMWSKSAPGQQPLGSCTNKFPEIYWPDPAWQCPYSLQWGWSGWSVKVHATPKHCNIANFLVKLFTAADQVSAGFSLILMSVVRWAQGHKVSAQRVLGELRPLCRQGWQDPGETRDQEQQQARQAIYCIWNDG